MTLNMDQESSIFKDLKTMAAMLVLFACFVFVMLILRNVHGLREKINKTVNRIKQSVFWNATIRSIDITYL